MVPRAATIQFFRTAEGSFADQAIERALNHAHDPQAADALVHLFLDRGRPEALAALLVRYDGLSDDVRERIRAACRASPAALGAAMRAGDPKACVNGLAIIEQNKDVSFAYLAAQALRDRSATARGRAGGTLRALVEQHLHRVAQARAALLDEQIDTEAGWERVAEAFVALGEERKELVRTLRPTVEQSIGHLHTEAVESAMLLVDDLSDVLFTAQGPRRTPLTHTLMEIFTRSDDPRLAAFAMTALGHSECRAEVLGSLARRRDTAFFAIVLEDRWRWQVPEVRKALRSLHQLAWLSDGISPLMALPERLHGAGVAFIASCALPHEVFFELMGGVLDFDSPQAAIEAVCALSRRAEPEATELLELSTGLDCAEARRIARAELQRRRRAVKSAAATGAGEGSAEWRMFLQSHALEPGFDNLWQAADWLEPASCASAGPLLFASAPGVEGLIRERLLSQVTTTRQRAHRLVAAFRLEETFATEIFAHADDSEPTTREAAVAALAHIGDATARRILERAANDADPRVRTAAVESMGVLGGDRSAVVLIAKFQDESPAVRLSAIRVLLVQRRPEAARALLDALRDGRAAHRLAALSLVGRMKLTALSAAIAHIAQSDRDEQVRMRAGRLLRAWNAPNDDAAAGAAAAAAPATAVAATTGEAAK